MSRRRSRSDADRAADALFDFLKEMPIWVGPLLAACLFVALRFVVPAIIPYGNEQAANVFAGLSKMFAPWIAIGVVGIWILAEIRKLGDRRRLDTRTDPASLQSISWQEFERLVGEYYRRRGYMVSETGAGADGGVDLVLSKNAERTLVQCKQWKTRDVGVKIVRELYGVMTAEGASGGVIVCCGRYTNEARVFAEGKPLELIDGIGLMHLINEVKKHSTRRVEHEEAPADTLSTPDAAPACPNCGSPMVLRTATKGQHAGLHFYGCTRYPRCRGILKLE